MNAATNNTNNIFWPHYDMRQGVYCRVYSFIN